MRFAFTDDQTLLADGLAAVAQRHWTREHLAQFWAGDRSVDEALAVALSEAGVLGLRVSDEHGGLGQSMLDLAPSLEVAGRHALPDWVNRHLLASSLLDDQSELATQAALGSLIIGVQIDDERVPHGPRLGGVLALRDTKAEMLYDCDFEPCDTVDLGRPLYALKSAQRQVLAEGQRAESLYRRAQTTRVLADGLQLLGIAQAALDLAVDYVKERQQFGKAIGAQQAVKHLLANALISLEFARPMVQRAAYACHHQDSDCDGRVSGAWLVTSEAARQVERAALQVHGAMGYSYEYHLHHLLKRSWALRHANGDAADHRQRAAAWILQRGTHA